MERPASHNHPAGESSPDYAPYPKLDPADLIPPPPAAAPATGSPGFGGPGIGVGGPGIGVGGPGIGVGGPGGATTMPADSNPYVTSAPAPPSAAKNAVDTVKDVLGRFGKKAAEAAKKTEDLAGNMWQHLKTGPSVADAAMGRIVQGTKVIAEGGYEKIFQQSFDTLPEEHLKKSYACYLSTSAGPVMGTLFLSTAKIAFCSDSPLSYKVGDQTEWSYYKVVIPLHQIRSVNPSTSSTNPGEKYIQVVSVDNHEFWFMAFVQYDSAVKNLQEAVHGGRNFQS